MREPSHGVSAALAAAIAVLAGLPSLVYPHGRDQGSYAYAGWRLLEGELPYRDVIAFKPPGTVLVHAASILIFGVNEVAIRALDVLGQAGAAAAVVWAAAELGARPSGALLAGLASGLLYWQVDYWNVAQTDGWTNLPLTLAIAASIAAFRRGGAAVWALAGLLVGFAGLLKYTALGALLPIAVVLAWKARSRRELGVAVGAGAAGVLAVFGATAAALVATGSWAGFAEIQFELVPGYVSGQRKGSDLGGALSTALALGGHKADVLPLVLAGPVGALLAWRGLPGGALAAVGAWWAVGASGLFAQGKFYDYHYLPLLAPAAILLGAGVDAAFRRTGRPAVAAGVAGMAALLGCALGPWGDYAREAASVAAGEPRVAMWARVKRYNYKDYDCAEVDAAGAWLAAHTEPDDPVFAWTYDPALLVRAERRQVSRFLYDYPLRVAWRKPAWEAEIVDALAADPPAAVVIATGDVVGGVTGNRRDSAQELNGLPALKGALDAGWCEVERVGRYRMWLPRGRGC